MYKKVAIAMAVIGLVSLMPGAQATGVAAAGYAACGGIAPIENECSTDTYLAYQTQVTISAVVGTVGSVTASINQEFGTWQWTCHFTVALVSCDEPVQEGILLAGDDTTLAGVADIGTAGQWQVSLCLCPSEDGGRIVVALGDRVGNHIEVG